MNIQISMKAENAEAILEEGMERIDQAAADRLQWKKRKGYGYYETECDVSEERILPVFKELIEKYPKLDIYAVYAEDIRDDDRSAQWWRVTKIKTEHHSDGTTTLSTDSETHWF